MKNRQMRTTGNALHHKAQMDLYSLCQTWLNLNQWAGGAAYRDGPGGWGGVGTRPWWLALLACGSAYRPLAFEPSATGGRGGCQPWKSQLLQLPHTHTNAQAHAPLRVRKTGPEQCGVCEDQGTQWCTTAATCGATRRMQCHWHLYCPAHTPKPRQGRGGGLPPSLKTKFPTNYLRPQPAPPPCIGTGRRQAPCAMAPPPPFPRMC